MAAHQAPRSLGFSRQEHWSGLPFPSPMHESEKWKWRHSVVSLLVTPWTAAYQAPPSMGFSRQEYWSGVPLRAVLNGSRPQLWWHWLHTLTLPWFSSLLLFLFLQTPGWEIVQSCFLLRCWYSECWKRKAVGEGPSESCLGSWQCRVEEEGPSLCPGRCLAVGRSQALFRSQLSYLPTVWTWVDSVSSLNLLSAVCGFALNHSHSPHIFPCEEPGCHSFPGIPRPSLLSLVFSGFSQRAFPLPVFPQITPETFLFP